jgi:hypothetical protein
MVRKEAPSFAGRSLSKFNYFRGAERPTPRTTPRVTSEYQQSLDL